MIRIWGRIPFSAGPQPPPLQRTEPYWQQMFSQQQVRDIHRYTESCPPFINNHLSISATCTYTCIPK